MRIWGIFNASAGAVVSGDLPASSVGRVAPGWDSVAGVSRSEFRRGNAGAPNQPAGSEAGGVLFEVDLLASLTNTNEFA